MRLMKFIMLIERIFTVCASNEWIPNYLIDLIFFSFQLQTGKGVTFVVHILLVLTAEQFSNKLIGLIQKRNFY